MPAEDPVKPVEPEESEAKKLANRLKDVEDAPAETWNPNRLAEAKPENDDIQLAAKDFENSEQFSNFIPTAQENEVHTKLGYIGTIYNKPDGEDKKPLVHIKQDGSLICPQAETEEDRKLQATAIANSLLITASKASTIPMPVIMKGFTAEELTPILDALGEHRDKIKIRLDPEHIKTLSGKEQSELKDLVENFNKPPANSQPTATLTTTKQQTSTGHNKEVSEILPEAPKATEKKADPKRASSPPQAGRDKPDPDLMGDAGTKKPSSHRVGRGL